METAASHLYFDTFYAPLGAVSLLCLARMTNVIVFVFEILSTRREPGKKKERNWFLQERT